MKRKFLGILLLLFPLKIFAHLISITATTPFPSTVTEYSISSATYTVTNISSGAIVIPVNQSQFPTGVSVLSSTLGNSLGPGESATVTLQLQPTSAQNISTALKVWAKPTLDAVQVPIHVTVTPVPTYDVIVIGAGISGLEAASVLQANNKNVLILEARNRTGGRIQTTTMDGAYTDLGATWLHDVDNNVLATIAQDMGIPLIPTPVIPPNGIGIYNNGTAVDPSTITDLFNFYPLLSTALLSRTFAYCGSFQDAVNCFVNTVIPPNPDNIYIAYAYNILYSSWYAGNTYDVSSLVGPSYLNLGHDAIPSIGYTNFLDLLFDIDSININLNSVVNKINYTNDNILINTTDGRAFSANYVVVTVPIGVLQANTIQFIPSLPAPQRTAIQNLGNGLLDKVYLQFPSAFWAANQTITLPYTANSLDNYYMIFNFGEFVNKPILLVFTIGDFAWDEEQLSDAEIVNNVMTQLRLIYPSAPDPLQIQITRWGQDPYSLGSYSYPSLNTSFNDIVNLTLPIDNRLFFAGEAINQLKDGTADAAYTSGFNAASAILQIMN